MHQPSGRPWWRRVLACCLALWFVALATDLPAVHTCAMHAAAGAAGGHHAAGAHGAAHRAAHGAGHTAGHADPAHADPAHGRGPGAPTGGACTCLGHCCGEASTGPAPAAIVAAVDVAAAAPAAPGRPAHEYVAAWADFVLPFSTAPPATAPA